MLGRSWRFHYNKPLTLLDLPTAMRYAAINFPDPERQLAHAVSASCRSGASLGSILSAIANAVGDDIYRRIPVTLYCVLTSLEAGRRVHDVLTAYISILRERSR